MASPFMANLRSNHRRPSSPQVRTESPESTPRPRSSMSSSSSRAHSVSEPRLMLSHLHPIHLPCSSHSVRSGPTESISSSYSPASVVLRIWRFTLHGSRQAPKIFFLRTPKKLRSLWIFWATPTSSPTADSGRSPCKRPRFTATTHRAVTLQTSKSFRSSCVICWLCPPCASPSTNTKSASLSRNRLISHAEAFLST